MASEIELIKNVLSQPMSYDVPPVPLAQTKFETLLDSLTLKEDSCHESDAVQQWCRENKNRFFIPEKLLRTFGLVVKFDYE